MLPRGPAVASFFPLLLIPDSFLLPRSVEQFLFCSLRALSLTGETVPG